MKILLIIIILAVTSGTAIPAEFTGRDIAIRIDAVDTSKDYKRTAVMVINRKGQKLKIIRLYFHQGPGVEPQDTCNGVLK